MAIYKSGEVTLQASAEDVFNKLSNLENLSSLIASIPEDKIPADQKKALESLTITEDSISFPGGPVGSLTLKMTERKAPNLIKLEGVGSPVPLSMTMHISPEGAFSSKGQVDIDIQIPALLKPMVGGQIQKIADQFGDMLKSIPFA